MHNCHDAMNEKHALDFETLVVANQFKQTPETQNKHMSHDRT